MHKLPVMHDKIPLLHLSLKFLRMKLFCYIQYYGRNTAFTDGWKLTNWGLIAPLMLKFK